MNRIVASGAVGAAVGGGLLVCAAMTMIAANVACSRASGTRSANIKEGDIDYPQLNASPGLTFEMSGNLPPSISLRLLALYVTDTDQADEATQRKCTYEVGGGSFSQALGIEKDLMVVRDGEHFHASIVGDYFVPGTCRWRIVGLGYRVIKGEMETARQGDLLGHFDVVQNGGGLRLRYHGRSDTWCKTNPRAKDNQHAERCGELSQIAPDLTKVVPEDRQGLRVEVLLSKDVPTLHLDFHDVDIVDPLVPRAR